MRHFSFSFTALIFVLVVSFAATISCVSAGGGFNGNRIRYFDYPQALTEARARNCPVMLWITKSWCKACKQLKLKVERSAEIEALSEYFVMSHAEDDNEPNDEKLAPNGSYSPRIMFITGDGELMPITNPSLPDPGSPHYYGSAPELVRGMVAALHYVGVTSLDDI